MEISAKLVKDLRDKTGIGMMKCKEALSECNGDLDAAIEFLRKKGLAEASRKAERATSQGRIGVYLHHDEKLCTMVEVNCETDFAANSPDFGILIKDLAMQVASARPLYVRREDVPVDAIEHEKEILNAQMADSGKPASVVEKIIEGRLSKFFSDVCLMEQPFIKDPKIPVGDLVRAVIAKLGENVVVRRFARFRVGEE